MVTTTKARKKNREARPAVESLINNAPRLFTEADFPVGTVSHQGDVMLVRIANLPASAKPRQQRQLADGSTMGSRHVMTRGDVYSCDASECIEAIKQATGVEVEEYLIGPVFVSPTSPTEHDLDHPEHGTQGFPDGSVMAVVYQRNLDAEERARRTVD